MKPTVIALLGRAGSGKSTAAEHILVKYKATRVSFAGPLKELAKHLLDLSDEQVYGSQEAKETVDERYGITPRLFMQRLGNGAREFLWKSVWVDAALERICADHAMGLGTLFVIDDCRYLNEVEILAASEKVDACVIKLVCPDAMTSADPNHPSEAEVDTVPLRLISHTVTSARSPGSVDLKAKIDEALSFLRLV